MMCWSMLPIWHHISSTEENQSKLSIRARIANRHGHDHSNDSMQLIATHTLDIFVVTIRIIWNLMLELKTVIVSLSKCFHWLSLNALEWGRLTVRNACTFEKRLQISTWCCNGFCVGSIRTHVNELWDVVQPGTFKWNGSHYPSRCSHN